MVTNEPRMTTVRRWSGQEVRALRDARRMSLREFAAHLGISDRMVSKWEAGGDQIHPRPVNQAALDTSLAQSPAEVRHRFDVLLRQLGSPMDEEAPATSTSQHAPVRHPVDGKLIVLIDSGIYLHGPSNEPHWLPAFYIDVYPTTNRDYGRFVTATGHAPPTHWMNGGCADELLDHPVVFVTWHDAAAYAAWAGKSLPSTHQWEKAARGVQGMTYPWGNSPTPAKCNCRESGPGTTSPVDRYHSGTSPFGVYDMCGNIWEWCDCESQPGRYELKGGAFTSPFARATPSVFNDASASMYDDDTGFRCVSPVEAIAEA